MIITVSGVAASGKSSIAKKIAEKLGYKHYSMGDLQRKLSKEKGYSWEEWHKLESSDPKYDRMVDEYQTKLAKDEDNFVIDSWLAACFIPQGFNIFLDADVEVRVKRRLKHKRTEEQFDSAQETSEHISKREKVNRDRWLEYYNFDYVDKKNYDFVLDTTHLSMEEVVEKCLEAIDGSENKK